MRPRALLMLIGLIIRAKLRRSLRGAKTPRGATFLAIAVVVLILWLLPSVLSAHFVPRSDPQQTRTVFPVLLLMMCLSNLISSAGERAVAFSPAEVDLLFAAPFTRRQLLAYKIGLGSFAAFTASLLFSLIFMRYATFWLSGFVGVFLSFMLLQLLSMTVVMIGQTIGEAAYLRGRKLALVALAVLVVASMWPLLLSSQQSVLGMVAQISNSPTGRVLLAPFGVFGRVVTAESIYPDMVRWSAVAVAILGGLFLVVMWLDAHYLEVSAAAGQRLYDRVRRVRRAGGVSLRTTGSARLRLPMPPRFAGAGPIAWRQLTMALRQSRSLLVLLLLICLVGGPVLYASGLKTTSTGALIGIAIWLTMMLGNTLRFDFRGDVDHIDVLKSLPVSPAAIVTAQLVSPALVMTLLQLTLLVGLAPVMKMPVGDVVIAMLLAVPFNLLLFGTENIFFVLFPARYAAAPGDLQGFGRQIVVFMLKLATLAMLAGVAGVGGSVVYAMTASQSAAFAVGGALLWIEVIGLIPALVAAYLRFDPSTDTPV